MKRIAIAGFVLFLFVWVPFTASSQSYISAMVTNPLNLRTGPGLSFPAVGVLSYGEQVQLDGRSSDYQWVHVNDNGTAGWVSTCCIRLQDGVLDTLAATEIRGAEMPNGESQSISFEPETGNTLSPVLQLGWQTFSIVARGRALGNRAGAFSKVGDCLTDQDSFFRGFGRGEYSLGEHGSLATTVGFFAATPGEAGKETGDNSFVQPSMAARGGFSAASILDPTWASAEFCESGESPLGCEYRRTKPAVALIMLGTIDVYSYPPETFGAYMSQIVQVSIDHGVVPVLTTVPHSQDDPTTATILAMNDQLRAIASNYGVPLIDLWQAAQELPHGGVMPDYALHLSGGGRYIDLGLAGTQGHALHNLLALQMLDQLRASVLQ
jgi:hypothetical protein